jgi:hypothetical protein
MSLVNMRSAAGVLGALGIAVVASSAVAQSASSAGASAINAKRNGTRVPAGYYAKPTGSAPRRGAGDGAYQYFSGSQGSGAIYWSPKTGAHLIYGPILAYFERNGHEERIGYPVDDPLPGPGTGCDAPDTVRRQSFSVPSRVSGNRIAVASTVLCEGPGGMVYPGVIALSTTNPNRPEIAGVSRTGRIGDTAIPSRGNEQADAREDDGYDDEAQDDEGYDDEN